MEKRYTLIVYTVLTALLFVIVTGLIGWAADPGTENKNITGAADISEGESASVDEERDGSDVEWTQSDDWRLILVNQQYPLDKDYQAAMIKLSNGYSVDERCYSDLQQMMDDCRAAGLSPLICSGYRSYDKQVELFENQIEANIQSGDDAESARIKAGLAVAVPGTSEHQLGLALDIVDSSHQILDETQESTPVQKWLVENSWRYGFILRYPNEKSHITGIQYEPWHYRYVGRDAAQEIHRQGVCLEEYLGAQ